ncbi:MAG: hypothetical protein HQL47_08655, partial [Gammaproteobacteria bacterium]|nr:hypothetical protein [Gammaproteobacteria bacterium]
MVFLLVFSLVAKWASLHLVSVLIIGALFWARPEDWRQSGVRTYLLFVSLWMLPFSLAVVAQHLAGLATATEPGLLIKLWLRTYGVGLGLILF